MAGINEQNFVDEAEKAIKQLKSLKDRNGKEIKMVTTSKIRNLLAMSAEIYNDVLNFEGETLDDDIKSRIEYLRVRFIYESGREPRVKDFVEKAQVLEVLKSVNGSKRGYVFFNRYMEALVAFHKYYGGKDQ